MTIDLSVLAGLDDVAWVSLEHAFGPAGDVPEMLRALASGDEEQAEAVMDDLFCTIWHQGTVYPATIPAVPFLVAIAVARAAGSQTPEVLRLLGYLAASPDPQGIEDRDAVRSAVAAHVDAFAGLLNDAEAKTRAAALFVLVYAATPDYIRPLIIERWHAETEPLPRAEALNAMMRVDAEASADLADEVLSAASSGSSPEFPLLSVSCALAWIHAGRPVDDRVVDAALTPIPEDTNLWHWDEWELFDQFISTLAQRHGTQAATELVVEALGRAREAPAEQIFQYLSSARTLIVSYRSAPGPLAAPLARLLELERPGLGRRLVSVLELIDPALIAAGARDRLAELAQAGAEPESDDAHLADEALECLARWSDPIVPRLFARTLVDRPRTLEFASGPGALPFDVDLLDAIRHRLNEICDAGQQAPVESGNLFADIRNRSESGQLVKILAAWGADAAPAVPELVRLLPVRPIVVAPVLAALRPQSLEGMAQLRRVAAMADGSDAVCARIAAAQAVRTLTDDVEPLLAAVRFGLTVESENPDDPAGAAEAALDLSDHADVLVPLLRQALQGIPVPTPSLAAHEGRIKLGRALWLLTGRPEYAIDVLRTTLDLAGEMFIGWTVSRAADLAAELGPAARDLAPALEAGLADAASCPAAAQALVTVDPAGPWATTRREELAGHLLDTLVASSFPAARSRALDVLSSLTPLSESSTEKLRALVDSDERVPSSVQGPESLRADDLIHERMRALLRK